MSPIYDFNICLQYNRFQHSKFPHLGFQYLNANNVRELTVFRNGRQPHCLFLPHSKSIPQRQFDPEQQTGADGNEWKSLGRNCGSLLVEIAGR